MELRMIARLMAVGRIVIGAALVVMPGRTGSPWIGKVAERRGAQVAIAAVGARDVALGAGTALAAGGKGAARPWLLASAGSDLVDLLATLRHRESLSRSAVIGVGALAGGSAAVGLWLASRLD